MSKKTRIKELELELKELKQATTEYLDKMIEYEYKWNELMRKEIGVEEELREMKESIQWKKK